jgi:predicted MFS family arabinose efflux permease
MDFHLSSVMRRAWLMVGLLWVVAFLNYLDRMILITMRSSIKASIPMTDAQFGMLTSIFLIVYGVLSPFGGFLADRFNRSRIIIFSLFAWSATTWLTAHATTFGEMLACRALMGISEAAYFPAAGALLMDYHTDRTRSRANGIHLSGVMVGSGLGGLGGWIADRQDWQFVFTLFGIIGVAYAGVLCFMLRDRPKDPVPADQPAAPAEPAIRPLETVRALFRRPSFIYALLFWGLLAVASWSFSGWLPTYLHERFGMSQGEAGLTALGYTHAASLIGMIAGGFIADRWMKRNPRGRILTGVVGVLIAAPAALLVGNSSVFAIVLLGMVIYGLVRPFPDASMMPLLTQIVEKRHLATALGFLNMLAVFIGGATVYIGGVVRDAQIPVTTVFNCGAVGLVICAGLLWSVKPRAPDASPRSSP